MSTLYFLKCENNKYYVGITRNLETRYQAHLSGKGSVWTKKYKPIEIIKIKYNCSLYDEDRYTKEYMGKYGIDNVRGGSYVTLKLTKEQKIFLRKEIYSGTNKCFRCGRDGHYVNNCYAKTTIDGESIDEDSIVSNTVSESEEDLEDIDSNWELLCHITLLNHHNRYFSWNTNGGCSAVEKSPGKEEVWTVWKHKITGFIKLGEKNHFLFIDKDKTLKCSNSFRLGTEWIMDIIESKTAFRSIDGKYITNEPPGWFYANVMGDRTITGDWEKFNVKYLA